MNSEKKKNPPLEDTEVDDKWISSKKNDWCYHCGKRPEKVVEMYSNYKNIEESSNGSHYTRICEECLKKALEKLNNEDK